MTIQEAMHTAIAGGYHIQGSDGGETAYSGANSEYSAWTRLDNQSSFLIPLQETFLDPAFWHALGRALGWDAPCDLAITCGDETCQRCHGAYWTSGGIRAGSYGFTSQRVFSRIRNPLWGDPENP